MHSTIVDWLDRCHRGFAQSRQIPHRRHDHAGRSRISLPLLGIQGFQGGPQGDETRGVTLDIAVFNDEPGGTTGVEDFRPGDEVEWNFFHDEVQYILKGKAEITYSLPPIHRKWYKTSAEEGSVYLIPRGARVKFKVIGNDPYRHLFVVMPGGFYPADKFDR